MFAEASAIRSAADLRFEICDDLPTLGCFWPVVWAEKHAYVCMGDDSDTEEYHPYGRFGGFTWGENLSRDEAQTRFKESVNLLHLGRWQINGLNLSFAGMWARWPAPLLVRNDPCVDGYGHRMRP